MSETLREIGFVAARSVRRTVRQPALIVPSIVFPLVLLAVSSSGLTAATKLPGFPTHSYLDFALTVCFMQGALFAAITAGTELATDIESGFLDRLQLTPLRPVAVLVGQLAGAAVLSLLATVVYLVVGVIAGVTIKAGVGGALVLIVLAMLVSMAMAGIGSLMASRTGRAEAVQGLFPLLFVTLFLSSANFPRNLMPVTWFRDIATYNPVSYLVEGMRSLVITGWDSTALAKGFGFAVVIAGLSFYGAARGLRTRMART
ncbi:MAG: type transport system permease protein [Solirubrobacteraceae bacterium]|jgi:ABC-2 type transport system permease protein|nr:type transport system permease protein [Solirubrobacteraceae bacterium]